MMITDAAEARKLLARLAALHDRCTPDAPWRVETEAHGYADGTTHFTHVVYDSRPHQEGSLKVSVGSCLTPDVADLMVLSRNHLADLVRWARRGIEADIVPEGGEPGVPGA